MNSIELIKKYPVKRFKKGSTIFQKGDSLTQLIAIRQGFIKVTSISDSGSERLLWIAGRYDLAPTEQLFSKTGSTRFYYTALTDVEYYHINKEDFMRQALPDATIMTDIARNMSLHYDDFLQRVDASDTSSVSQRLLRTLVYLAQRLSADSTVEFHSYGLRLTHQDLSAMIGAARETTSGALAKIRKDGYIEYSAKALTVHVDKIEEKLNG